MNNNISQNYNKTLQEYLNDLRMQENTNSLPNGFNLTADQFIKDLNRIRPPESRLQ